MAENGELRARESANLGIGRIKPQWPAGKIVAQTKNFSGIKLDEVPPVICVRVLQLNCPARTMNIRNQFFLAPVRQDAVSLDPGAAFLEDKICGRDQKQKRRHQELWLKWIGSREEVVDEGEFNEKAECDE